MEHLVTFGSSGLDRASEMRSDPQALAAALADPRAGVIPVWRGKLLMWDDALVWLTPQSHVFDDARDAPVFLGRDNGKPRFARDISLWEPEADASDVGAFVDNSLQYHPDAPKGTAFVELRMVMTRLTRRDAELAASARAALMWHDGHRFCARCGGASDMVNGGWQRECGTCGRVHFPRTDPVVIMLITHGNSVLVGRSPAWPKGFFSLLAGFVEPGETVEAAVRREVYEEAGVRIGPVRYLVSQPWPFPASLMLGCAGEALTTEIRLDRVELEEARWVPREEMVEVFAGRHSAMSEPRRGAIAHSLIQAWLSDRVRQGT